MAEWARADTRHLVIDFTDFGACPSQFVGELIRTHQAVKTTGRVMRVCCPTKKVGELFGLTQIDRVILTYQTLEEALRGL